MSNTTVAVDSVFPAIVIHTVSSESIQSFNMEIKKLFDYVVEFYDTFVVDNGRMKTEHNMDAVHLSMESYQAWLACIIPLLDQYL